MPLSPFLKVGSAATNNLRHVGWQKILNSHITHKSVKQNETTRRIISVTVSSTLIISTFILDIYDLTQFFFYATSFLNGGDHGPPQIPFLWFAMASWER